MVKAILYILLVCVMFTSCGKNKSVGIIGGADGPTSVIVSEKGDDQMYEQITSADAKQIMDSGVEHIILDVREQDEYESGHIPGAILIPYTQINADAEQMLADKDALILVYCRSGRRSKIAAESLVGLGYTNVKEFGGINDWVYDIEK